MLVFLFFFCGSGHFVAIVVLSFSLAVGGVLSVKKKNKNPPF
eukprot:COSAG06_NODE_59541_length_274_cov_0.451429_1_plen_41_part_10